MLLLAGALGLQAEARAAGLELLIPQDRITAEGTVVAAGVRDASGWSAPVDPMLRARGAQVSPLPAAGPLPRWRVTPDPGARAVQLTVTSKGAEVTRELHIGPPAAQLRLALEPAAPVKGRDREARLTVHFLDSQGRPQEAPAPPVLRASVGSVEDVEAVAPGVFRARYVLPSTRHPEVAVLVAFAPWPHPDAVTGATGALRIPLSTAIDLPGTSEPGATMSLQIAGKDYGPVQIREDGRFEIPVVVPPGEGVGRSTVQDRLGNRRVAKMDLRLPPVDPLACVANPTRLPGDGVSRARILCAVSDPRGRAVEAGRVQLVTRHGRLEGPRATTDGLLEWSYTSPARDFDTDTLQASVRIRGVRGHEAIVLTGQPSAPAVLSLSSREPRAHRGGLARIGVLARDAQGRAVRSATLVTRVTEGAIATGPWSKDGDAELTWTVPATAQGPTGRVEVQALGAGGESPARLWSWSEGGRLRLAVTDPGGLPVVDAPLRLGEAEVRTGFDGTVSLPLPPVGAIDLVHARWTELRLRLHVLGNGAVFPSQAPPMARASLELPLGPALPVDVRLSVRGRSVRYWAEDSTGRLLPDRALRVRMVGAELPASAQEPDGRMRLELPAGAQLISVSDALTGVTAAAQVVP